MLGESSSLSNQIIKSESLKIPKKGKVNSLARPGPPDKDLNSHKKPTQVKRGGTICLKLSKDEPLTQDCLEGYLLY